MGKDPQTENRQVLLWKLGARPRRQKDALAAEEPMEIRIDTHPIVVTMRTPGHDRELAAGFLLSEGLIHTPDQILKIAPHPRTSSGNTIDVFLAPSVTIDFAQLTRHVFASSSCGLCGKAAIKAVHQHFKKVTSRVVVPAKTILTLPNQLQALQQTFSRTGGLHAAAIFTAKGQLVVAREDIGRHNAVDKVLGFGLLKGLLPFDQHILLVSGRASFEICQKALSAGIPIVTAISAPSSLAVKFAADSGQTLIGFLRENRLNIYTRPARIRLS